MAIEKPQISWRHLPKVSFSSRDLSKRMQKVEGVTVRHARRFVFRRWSNFREVRRHIAIWILLIGLIIGATGLQLMWYQAGYRTVAAANNGTYAEAVLGPVTTLNPLFVSTSAEESLSQLLFSRLLTYDDTGTINYDLATGLVIDDTQKIYTLTLRSDAKWHDGLAVTSKDVVFTVELLKNAAVRSTITGWGGITATAVDNTTVSFTLPAPYAAFPDALAGLPIVPDHLLRDVEPGAIRENNFSRSPVGSGPFKLRFVQDIDPTTNRRIVHLAQNTDYYRGVPKLDRFQLHVYGSREAIMNALATNEVNAAVDLSILDAGTINPNRYDVQRLPIKSGVYALFNTTGALLKDPAIRRALQLGTDTSAVRAALGEGTPALYLPFVAGQLRGDVPAAPVYDAAAAASTLDQAGWVFNGSSRTKDGVDLKLSVVATKDSDFEKTLEVLGAQWRQLGISVTTRIIDPTDPSQGFVQSVLQPRNFDILVYPLKIGADADIFAYWHSSQANTSGYNFANYSNATSDDALASARGRRDPDLRNLKSLIFARQWLADAPAIGLYQSTTQYVSAKTVKTIENQDVLNSAIDRYANVLYWTVGERVVFRTP